MSIALNALAEGEGSLTATGVVPGFWNPLDTNIVESVEGKSSLISFDGHHFGFY